jgi:2-oxoglutarate ferredoxin oxidoreductase subunit beta
MDDLATYRENTWCPGCGNFGILNAFKKAVTRLEEDRIVREKIVISSGIGCHAKISEYLALSSIHSIHGRAPATAQGIKIANPGLKPIAFVGDGDAMSEGIAHLVFAAKRNADITVIMHNNGVYALTTGQFTPTSEKGFRGPSTPKGSVEEPLRPCLLMLDSGATFVARGYPVKLDHLAGLITQAVMHEGFSFLEVLQPCVSFNNTYDKYNRLTEVMYGRPTRLEEAVRVARRTDRLPIGVIYQSQRPVFHHELFGDRNPVQDRMEREKRVGKLRDMLSTQA